MTLYALHEGVYLPYIVGAPEFVNGEFRERFGDGLGVMAPLVAGSNGPTSADPFGDELDGAGPPPAASGSPTSSVRGSSRTASPWSCSPTVYRPSRRSSPGARALPKPTDFPSAPAPVGSRGVPGFPIHTKAAVLVGREPARTWPKGGSCY